MNIDISMILNKCQIFPEESKMQKQCPKGLEKIKDELLDKILEEEMEEWGMNEEEGWI